MLPLEFLTTPNERGHATMHDHLDTILVHRLGVGATARDAVNAFQVIPGFGGKFPYHFTVAGDGTVTQTLPLSRKGLHALAWNSHAVGVACLGDFTRAAPTDAQWRAARLLCGLLAYFQGWDVLGHSEAHTKGPAATRDASKECPGPKWHMGTFRDELRELLISQGDAETFWRRVRC